MNTTFDVIKGIIYPTPNDITEKYIKQLGGGKRNEYITIQQFKNQDEAISFAKQYQCNDNEIILVAKIEKYNCLTITNFIKSVMN